MSLALSIPRERLLLMSAENDDPVQVTIDVEVKEGASMDTLLAVEGLLLNAGGPDSVVYSTQRVYKFNSGLEPKIYLGLPDRVILYEPDKGNPSDEELEKVLAHVDSSAWTFVRDTSAQLLKLQDEEMEDFTNRKELQPESFTIFSVTFKLYELLLGDLQQVLKRCAVETADKVINEISTRLCAHPFSFLFFSFLFFFFFFPPAFFNQLCLLFFLFSFFFFAIVNIIESLGGVNQSFQNLVSKGDSFELASRFNLMWRADETFASHFCEQKSNFVRVILEQVTTYMHERSMTLNFFNGQQTVNANWRICVRLCNQSFHLVRLFQYILSFHNLADDIRGSIEQDVGLFLHFSFFFFFRFFFS